MNVNEKKILVDISQHSGLKGGGQLYANGLVEILLERPNTEYNFLINKGQNIPTISEKNSSNITDFQHNNLHPSDAKSIINRIMFDLNLNSDSSDYASIIDYFDLLHFTGDRMSPYVKNKPTVITFFGANNWMNLVGLRNPRSPRQILVRKTLRKSLMLCSAILTPSIYLKDYLVKQLEISPNKIFVNPLICMTEEIETIDSKVPEQLAVKEKCDLFKSSRNLLFSAAGYEYKNHKRLFDAVAKINNSNEPPVSLCLTGAGSEITKNLLSQYKNEIPFIDLGYVSRENLKWLYENVSAYVHPSLYEAGGSFSMYEAARCGCPVACSDIGSMQEFGKNFCVMFDPYSVDDMAIKLQEMLTNESGLAKMSATGRKYVNSFSNSTARNELNAAYQYALNNFDNR